MGEVGLDYVLGFSVCDLSSHGSHQSGCRSVENLQETPRTLQALKVSVLHKCLRRIIGHGWTLDFGIRDAVADVDNLELQSVCE